MLSVASWTFLEAKKCVQTKDKCSQTCSFHGCVDGFDGFDDEFNIDISTPLSPHCHTVTVGSYQKSKGEFFLNDIIFILLRITFF